MTEQDLVEPRPVDVYRNLNNDCVSVRSRKADDYGTVVGHEDSALVLDPSFVVQPAGREKVREEECKNVHAFVRGRLLWAGRIVEHAWTVWTRRCSGFLDVNYNPYEQDEFEVIDVEGATNYAVGDEVTDDDRFQIAVVDESGVTVALL